LGTVRDERLEKLKKRLHLKSADVLVIASFLFFSLRVINWFEYPNVVTSGDLRPQLVQEAFTKRVVYTWDEIDFGMPSIYPPRILDPFYFFITIFQTFGVNLYLSQIVTVFLMYFFSSILMYIFVRQITNGDIIASFVAALYLTSNVYLINDREVTAIGFIGITLIILPCLITFAKAIKTYSYGLMTVSGILCILTNATFPNYRTILICSIMVGLISIFFFIGNGLHIGFYNKKCSRKTFQISLDIGLLHHYLKLLAVFATAFFLASLWVVALIYSYFDVLNTIYSALSAPWFVGGLGISDVTRLIAKWGVYSGALGMPYLPYVNVYKSNPLIVNLCYLPAILAFSSLLSSKERKTSIFFGCVAISFLLLTTGFSFSDYGKDLYSTLMEFPLLKAFREASNWIFFVIISFSILIGCTVSALCHKFKGNALRIFTVGLVVALFSTTAYPLVTGDVARNWLNPSTKGSYFPSSYAELNTMLSSQYWAMLLPQRDTYVVYNFSEGQFFNSGNPFPLVFSKPVISGVGTEYIQSEYLELINKLHELMRTDPYYKNAALEGKASASSIWDDGFEPDKAVDGLRQTRWASRKGVPQWLEIDWNQSQDITKISITFEFAYPEDYKIQMWDGFGWTTHIIVENNTSTEYEHVFPQPITTTKLRLYCTKPSLFGIISIWELEIQARTEGLPKFLGILGIRYLILEKNIIQGNAYNVSELRLDENENFILAGKWDELTLLNNTHAVQKLYVAHNLFNYTTLNDMYRSVENCEWNTLKHSIFINSTTTNKIKNNALQAPENFVWRELCPISYEVRLTSKGPFILVLLESYDPQWKLSVNNSPLPEESHLNVNAFANGWLIESTGNLTITVDYETQKILTASVAISIISPALLLALLSRAELKTLINIIHHKLKRKLSNV